MHPSKPRIHLFGEAFFQAELMTFNFAPEQLVARCCEHVMHARLCAHLLHVSSHLLLTTTPGGTDNCYLYYTDKEIKLREEM